MGTSTPIKDNSLEQALEKSSQKRRNKKRLSKTPYKKKGTVSNVAFNTTPAKKNSDLAYNKKSKNLSEVTCFKYNRNAYYSNNYTIMLESLRAVNFNVPNSLNEVK